MVSIVYDASKGVYKLILKDGSSLWIKDKLIKVLKEQETPQHANANDNQF